ncbi:hypothetical protein ABW20_dc0110171 [Dactylellina cionopaga]|nr:hypothetical protein ABW20_dc0110171 [Dactylellina cionopaga]
MVDTDAPEQVAANTGSQGLNQKSLEILATVLQYATVDISNVPFETVAKTLGYRNAETAKKRYQQVKKQITDASNGEVKAKPPRGGGAGGNANKRGKKPKFLDATGDKASDKEKKDRKKDRNDSKEKGKHVSKKMKTSEQEADLAKLGEGGLKSYERDEDVKGEDFSMDKENLKKEQ